MHDLISTYHETVADAVTRFGGYVAKFLGDGVLVYFGWPMAYEDHAERTIRAGVAAITMNSFADDSLLPTFRQAI
jgi:class 3 adenylate cyclase